jgi:hypothetical protein
MAVGRGVTVPGRCSESRACQGGILLHCVAVLERTGPAILLRDSSIPDQQASHLLTSPQATADGGPGVYGIGPAGLYVHGY